MKKIINDPFAFVDEMLEGIILAHPDKLKLVGADRRAIVRADAPDQGQGRHRDRRRLRPPARLHGLRRQGAVRRLLDRQRLLLARPSTRCSPPPRPSTAGAGVLYLFGNYSGDVMNFDMAAEMADAGGHPGRDGPGRRRRRLRPQGPGGPAPRRGRHLLSPTSSPAPRPRRRRRSPR